MADIRFATNEELIRRFEEAAIIHRELRTAREANRAFREGIAIWLELKVRGEEATALFLDLLNSAIPAVRLSSAAKALFIAPEMAEGILEELANAPGTIGFDAEMTLKQWRTGKLSPPA